MRFGNSILSSKELAGRERGWKNESSRCADFGSCLYCEEFRDLTCKTDEISFLLRGRDLEPMQTGEILPAGEREFVAIFNSWVKEEQGTIRPDERNS